MAKKEIVSEKGGVKLTPYEIFKEIQSGIVVGKGKFNSFAKFYFRSVEDIYKAWNALSVPLVLRLSDEVIERNGHIFIEATAQVKDLAGNVVEYSKAQAELGVGKAGMSTEQATGSASSYARKYALNGLFLLDDSKDPDEATGTPTAVDTTKSGIAAQRAKVKELQELIRGDTAKVAEATKLLAGRSVIRLAIPELEEIINGIKSK